MGPLETACVDKLYVRTPLALSLRSIVVIAARSFERSFVRYLRLTLFPLRFPMRISILFFRLFFHTYIVLSFSYGCEAVKLIRISCTYLNCNMSSHVTIELLCQHEIKTLPMINKQTLCDSEEDRNSDSEWSSGCKKKTEIDRIWAAHGSRFGRPLSNGDDDGTFADYSWIWSNRGDSWFPLCLFLHRCQFYGLTLDKDIELAKWATRRNDWTVEMVVMGDKRHFFDVLIWFIYFLCFYCEPNRSI